MAEKKLPKELILKRNKLNLLTIGSNIGDHVRVFPGVNRYTKKEDIETIITNPQHKRFLDSKVHEILSDVPEDKGTDTDVFTSMNVEEAKDVIVNTYSIAALEQMRADETNKKNRSSVLNAIEAQIDRVKNPSDEDLGKE